MIFRQNDLVEAWQSVVAYHDVETLANQWFEPAYVVLFLILFLYSSLLASDHPWLAIVACAFSAGAFSTYMPRHQKIDSNVYMDIKPKRNIEIQPRNKKTGNSTELHLSDPMLTEKTTNLINFTIRDFISLWWGPMNFYKNREFEDEIRITINATVETFERSIQAHDSNDLLLAMLYGVANSLIIHMREYREFEDSQLDLHEFTRRNPSSPFAQLLSRDEQHQQLRELGYSFIQKMVPKEDLASPIIASFFKEVFASYALESILTLLCDPDYLNLCIVDALNDATEESDKISADNSLSQLEGFRSVVEKAAEDAMATKTESVESTEMTNSSTQNLQQPQVPQESIDEGNKIKKIPKHEDQLEVRTSTSSSTLNDEIPGDDLYPKDSPKSTNSEQKWHTNRTSIDSAKSSTRSATPLQPSAITEQLPMLFERGTVSFSIMDISPSDTGDKIDIASLLYFVQIERSANNDKRQSEGGGYILTRTYDNFVTLHSVLSARYPKVVSKLSLKLPLEQSRSWRNSRAHQNNRDAICQGLERYLHTVADNDILGRDKNIHVFFRKEQSSNDGVDTIDTMSTQPAPEEESAVSKTRNYFGGSSASLNIDEDKESGSPQQISPRSQYSRWINRKVQRQSSLKELGDDDKRPSRQHSVDKLHVPKVTAMEATLINKEEDQPAIVKSPDSPHDNQKTQNTHKKLNSIEVELLIETTFALITEIFQLTEANQSAWLRRTALNLLREVIRRSYAEVISQQFVKYMEEYAQTSYFTTLITTITDMFWPDGEWDTNVVVRTPEEKAATKSLARELLKTRGVPSGARQLIGELNCLDAMERLWSRCQDVDLNRVLGVQLLERTLRPLVN
ncbi:PXA domain-containing protein [Umbelopsis sp. PMI_123]|nr:PXA domain-containing protein [Umbelopsis sp. PMI_123]